MMLAGPTLRAVPVTIHIALADVPAALTTDAIVTTAHITASDLVSRFGIARPRLAVAGLNPHAGEGGAMGSEDEEIVRPAVETLRAEGIDAIGPRPADTMFHARARAGYDAAICMYHDQALIPAKALAFDETVNVTLGLPFVRTSPDHGTAFDIAGKGIARADSLIAALKHGASPVQPSRGRGMSADGLPPLREVIERHGLAAKKSLGQNFLLDLNLTGKIARAAGDLTQHTVIEVGPGPGGLTRALLLHGAKKVVAIERDERCLAALAEIAAHYPGRLEIISGDAMKTDFTALVPDGPAKIVANLPYNIGTELLIRWLTVGGWPPFYGSMTLMFQREVAQRIVASVGSDAYGRLGILAGWRTEAKIAFDVPPQAFTPPPKVTSSVVHLVPRAEPLPADVRKLGRVTEAAFGQRRKMLRQSLKSLGGERLLVTVGIDATRRAETLSIAEFVQLANAV